MPRAVALWGPVALYMAAIFCVSSLPKVALPPGIGDKPAHSASYLGLGVVVVRAVAGRLPARITWTTARAALAITIGYGVSDELHQRFVPGRSAEFKDVFADAVGGLLGTVLCWAWGIISPASRDGAPRHDL